MFNYTKRNMNILTRNSNIFKTAGHYVRYYCEKSSENIQDLVKKSKIVVFMKGVPEEPRCGFSNAVVQILRMHGVTYDSYDVLKNEALRQGRILDVERNCININ